MVRPGSQRDTDSDPLERVSLPAVSFKAVVAARTVVHKTLSDWSGSVVKLHDVREMTDRLARHLLPRGFTAMAREHGVLDNPSRHALEETLTRRLITGSPLKPDRISDVAALIGGNVPALKAGRVLNLWRAQTSDEWVLLTVLEAFGGHGRGRLGATLKLSVLTGSPAGKTFNQFFTSGFLNKIAIAIGVLSRRDDRPVHPREMVKMKLLGLLEVGDALKMAEYGDKPVLTAMNKALARQRGAARVCPHQYKHACWRCPVGYLDCLMGTQRNTQEWRACATGCGATGSGWFDIESPGTMCHRCPERGRAVITTGGRSNESGFGSGTAGTEAGGVESGRGDAGEERETGGECADLAEPGQGADGDVPDVHVQGAEAGRGRDPGSTPG